VIAFPYGGDHSYWHDRRDGRWGTYVLREVIPQAARISHSDPRRVAIGGISMGGFGAYDLARLSPERFCAIGGHSAALWSASGDTAPGAFDDYSDYARNDVIAAAREHPRLYGRTRLWLDGGDADPFHAPDEALAAALGVRMHVWPGGHDSGYWNAHWRDYLTFYAAALAQCQPPPKLWRRAWLPAEALLTLLEVPVRRVVVPRPRVLLSRAVGAAGAANHIFRHRWDISLGDHGLWTDGRLRGVACVVDHGGRLGL
jgi:hypothetical protein